LSYLRLGILSPRYTHTPNLQHGYIDGLANREVFAPWHVANYVDTNASNEGNRLLPKEGLYYQST